MKMIVYAGDELVTGDDIADAVLDYCAALAGEKAAETIEIPVIEKDGSRGVASILVGPASQVVLRKAPGESGDLVDQEIVRELRQKAAAHRPVASTPTHAPAALPYDATWEDGI